MAHALACSGELQVAGLSPESDSGVLTLSMARVRPIAFLVGSVLAVNLSISSLWAQAETASHNTLDGPRHSATGILERAIETLSAVTSAEYTVRAIPSEPAAQDSAQSKGQTVVTALTSSPRRYRRFQVTDGEQVRTSAGGQLREYPTRTMEDRASADALPTLPAFDPDTYWNERRLPISPACMQGRMT